MRPALRTLRPYVAPEWRALAVAMACTLAVVAAWLARPLPIALVVDRLLDQREIPFELDSADWRFVALVAGLVLAIALLSAVGGRLADERLAAAGEHITHRLRVATYAQLQRLSLSFHEGRHPGDLATRVTGDVSAVGGLFPGALGDLASATMLLLGMLAVSVVIDPLLALTAFAAAPALALVSYRFRRQVKSLARRQRAKESEIASLSEESFAAMRLVKALGVERFEEERLRRRSEELRDLELEASGVEGRFAGITDVLGAVALAFVLVVGVLRVAAGAVTPGELVVMWTYARRIDRPLRGMARSGNRLARGLTRAERVAEVLAADEFLEERSGAYAGPRATGALELREVSFSYQDARPALSGFTLRIRAGERVFLTGRSGAGKSTVAALIARFYDPQRGSVSLDGRDLRDCSLSWLRDQIGLVLQETVLFTGTVAQNIAYGLDADAEAVVAAAKSAGAHAFIAELPQGYDTTLGPRGVGLSGGERQRLAIARVVLRDPPVLLLDEPTAGLDAASEAQVLDGLGAAMRGRTTLLISHALALARRCDRIMVVDSGRVVESRKPTAPSRGGARPVPQDDALPGMRALLDPAEMAPVLHKQAPPGSRPPDVRLRYLRYKPSTNLVVHYDVGLDGAWRHATAMIAARDYLQRRAEKAESRRLAELVDGRSGVPVPLAYEPGIGALVQWLPLDLSLPALALRPEELRRELRAAGVDVDAGDGEPELLAYKPRRRAVLRIRGHVLKYYAQEAALSAAAAGLDAAMRSPLTAPRLEATLPELRLSVQTHLAGSPVPSPAEVAGQAGWTLTMLHRTEAADLPVFTARDQLDAACASARLVCRLVPKLARRVTVLVGALAEAMPDDRSIVCAHGDFNARQLLEQGEDLVVTDFDETCAAAPALDLATYGAYLVRGDDDDLERAEATVEDLVDGYGDRPEALDWYLATMVLRRAPRPFRYLDEHWPHRVQGMVRAAESVCAR